MFGKLVSLLGVLVALCAILVLASCGGSDPLPEQKATRLLGGILSNFGGNDGDNATARMVASDIAASRSFDFTPAGFVVADGVASSTGQLGSGYGNGTGTITVNGGTATVEMEIVSSTADVSGISLTGTFSATSAQAAIDSPGSSFFVDWVMEFEAFGTMYKISSRQVLSGSEWVGV